MTSRRAQPQPAAVPAEREVLTKAVVNAAKALGVSQSKVASTLGVSDPTASRMFTGKYLLDPARALSSDATMESSENSALGARPVDLLPSAEGLIRVLLYLDAARGRV